MSEVEENIAFLMLRNNADLTHMHESTWSGCYEFVLRKYGIDATGVDKEAIIARAKKAWVTLGLMK